MTPKQICPLPEGLGVIYVQRLDRWFKGFCNTHQVSHFAMLFIDTRAEISVATSSFRLQIAAKHLRTQSFRRGECQPYVCMFFDTFYGGFVISETKRSARPRQSSRPGCYAKQRIRWARYRLRNQPTYGNYDFSFI